MMAKRFRGKKQKPGGGEKPGKRPSGELRSIGLRRIEGGEGFELVYPRCVTQREADMEEVRLMLDAGEFDVARDELRWLLDGCQPLLEAHKLLGEIAMTENDMALARGHFGYAWQLGTAALPKDGMVRLPYDRPANQPLLESGKGLAWALMQAGEKDLAAEVVGQILRFDPADPLKVREAFPGLTV